MMAYIIHLVNVMRGVFLTVGQSGAHSAIPAVVLEQVVDRYHGADVKKQVDGDVEKFTKDKALWSAGRDDMLENVTSLTHL